MLKKFVLGFLILFSVLGGDAVLAASPVYLGVEDYRNHMIECYIDLDLGFRDVSKNQDRSAVHITKMLRVRDTGAICYIHEVYTRSGLTTWTGYIMFDKNGKEIGAESNPNISDPEFEPVGEGFRTADTYQWLLKNYWGQG